MEITGMLREVESRAPLLRQFADCSIVASTIGKHVLEYDTSVTIPFHFVTSSDCLNFSFNFFTYNLEISLRIYVIGELDYMILPHCVPPYPVAF